ncbi:hypothetical protein FA15DRAFT_661070 [Coprinopsis marcescibilis]|uniref:Uncharacterized protein n=1 Tax=Coprinopsis marcescibilis TaxID=230819 RepID=A0A5C3KE77_COPMA|nr:hypothetical protein FA15DRAFT_661070 [Coprinopsis marcescibilis]
MAAARTCGPVLSVAFFWPWYGSIELEALLLAPDWAWYWGRNDAPPQQELGTELEWSYSNGHLKGKPMSEMRKEGELSSRNSTQNANFHASRNGSKLHWFVIDLLLAKTSGWALRMSRNMLHMPTTIIAKQYRAGPISQQFLQHSHLLQSNI